MRENKIFYGWWIVLGGAIVLALLGPASVAVANLFQTPVTEEFGISNSQFAISNSIVLGVGIFLSPYISQKFATGNFKLVYVIGLITYILAYMGFGLAPNIYVFYVLSLFVGFGFMSTTIIPVSMLINNWFIEKRGLALSLALSGLGIGGVVFSQVLTPLIFNFGWRQTYFIYAAIMLVVALPIVLFIFKAKPEMLGLTALGAAEDGAGNAPSQQKAEQSPKAKLGMTPYFIMLLVGAVCVGLANNGGLGQFPPVLYSLHGPAIGAMVVSVYSAVGILGKLLLGNINDRFGTIVSTIYAASLLAAAYFIMLFAGDVTFAIIMAVVFGLGNAMGTVAPPLITSAIFAKEDFPKAYGFLQSAMQLGMTLGSLVAASIADFTGTYSASWITLSIISALSAVMWVSAYRTAKGKN